MVRWLGVLTVVVMLAGCGGGSDDTQPTTDGSPSESPAAVGMKDICPQVESALPNAMVPTREQMTSVKAKLLELTRTADLESQNALKVLSAGADEMIKAHLDGGPSALVDGVQAWDGSISTFADRCAAAGSSALQ